MLSVLIPVYNHDVNSLVKTLDQQLAATGIAYEIILADDCSEKQYQDKNISLASTERIQYIQNHANIGRAKIRNLLADNSKYPYLLFIDCDACIHHQDYIIKYIEAINKMRMHPKFVINGGVAYQEEKPDKKYYLRWFYGKKREEEKASLRAQNPYHHFTPFNVIISKAIFEQLRFDESLTSYGHEDTLFGYQLKTHKIPYLHIDNPLIHNGLDTNEEFLQKIRTSIDNIIYLSKNQQFDISLWKENKLLKAYRHCNSVGLQNSLASYFKNNQIKMQERLSSKPNMKLLDLYKLSYLAFKNIEEKKHVSRG